MRICLLKPPVFSFKVMHVGDSGVGKTNFFTKITQDKLPKKDIPTVGVEFFTKKATLNDGTIEKISIWDTSGAEKYKPLVTAHFRGTKGAFLFFDLTNLTTFEHAKDWLKEIRSLCEDDCAIILIGNKLDLVHNNPETRAVRYTDVISFAADNNLKYYEVSVKTGYNVKESFEDLLNMMQEVRKKKGLDTKITDYDPPDNPPERPPKQPPIILDNTSEKPFCRCAN